MLPIEIALIEGLKYKGNYGSGVGIIWRIKYLFCRNSLDEWLYPWIFFA